MVNSPSLYTNGWLFVILFRLIFGSHILGELKQQEQNGATWNRTARKKKTEMEKWKMKRNNISRYTRIFSQAKRFFQTYFPSIRLHGANQEWIHNSPYRTIKYNLHEQMEMENGKRKKEKNTIEIIWSEIKINNKNDENNHENVSLFVMYNSRLLVVGWNNTFECCCHFHDGQWWFS